MNRDVVLKLLRAHKATLVQRFGVVDLALFGSIVRNQDTGDSDVQEGEGRKKKEKGRRENSVTGELIGVLEE